MINLNKIAFIDSDGFDYNDGEEFSFEVFHEYDGGIVEIRR